MKTVSRILFCLISFYNAVYASADRIDVYGVEPALQAKIMACCKEQLVERQALLKPLYSGQGAFTDAQSEQFKTLEQSILKKINRIDNFSFAMLSTVFYSNKKGLYTTVDLVKKSDSQRLPMSTKRIIKKHLKPTPEVAELLKTWDNYVTLNFKLIQAGKRSGLTTHCPVAHCLWDFTAQDAKELLPVFKSGASKHKNQLMDLVRFSKDSELRANAILILGNTQNYDDLAAFLMPLVADADSSVRNNTMRVLGFMMMEHPVKGIDPKPILTALNYPYTTDRNKAGLVLLGIVNQDKSIHPLVINTSGDTLVNILRLKQPDNHDFAYSILKVLSHKNFSEYDYVRWQKWVDSAKT